MTNQTDYCRVKPARNKYAAQIWAGSRNYSLGGFNYPSDAAAAYDNAAYYLREAGYIRKGKLNFPEQYAAENGNIPPAMPRTLLLLAEIARNPPNAIARRVAKVSHNQEILRVLKEILAVVDSAAAILATSAGLKTKLDQLLSDSPK